MTAYIPAAIWLLSHAMCLHIARRRGIQANTAMTMLAVLLGPAALPIALLAKPNSSHQRR
jgi:hypothetical protein